MLIDNSGLFGQLDALEARSEAELERLRNQRLDAPGPAAPLAEALSARDAARRRSAELERENAELRLQLAEATARAERVEGAERARRCPRTRAS